MARHESSLFGARTLVDLNYGWPICSLVSKFGFMQFSGGKLPNFSQAFRTHHPLNLGQSSNGTPSVDIPCMSKCLFVVERIEASETR